MTVGANPGVTIGGGLATFGSSDNSLEVEGGPALGQVDLKLTGGPALRTLQAIYAFGLADVPAADNLFNMPGGNLSFPGALNWGTNGFAASVIYRQTKAAIDLSRPPAYERISMASQISGVGGSGNGFFRIAELNDPLWNGTFAQLNAPWLVEGITYSKDAVDGPAHAATEYARRSYDPFGQSPFIPGGARVGGAARHLLSLWNASTAAEEPVDVIDGYGMVEKALIAKSNGANAQWVTHWRNSAAVPAAGDGPAWVVDGDGRFAHLAARAALQAQQTAASVDAAWAWSLQGFDGAAFVEFANFSATASTVRGQTIATVDTGGIVTQAFVSAKIDWTNTGGTYDLKIAPKPGYGIFQSVTRLVITDAVGVQTANPTLKAGNNASGDNFIVQASLAPTPASTAFAVAAGVSPATPYLGGSYSQSSTNANSLLPILGTPVILTIVVGATGVATLKGYVITVCSLVPLALMP